MDIPMINEINDNTNAAAEAVKNAILNAMPAAGIDQTALDAAVAEILAGMPTGGGLTSCIRKIQRGVVSLGNAYSTEISLSGFSNLNKMFVLINGTYCYGDDYCDMYLKALTTSKLTVAQDTSGKNSTTYAFSYQVIEFY